MAHDLVVDKLTNLVPMAFTGSRDAIWHGLGQQLEAGKTIDEWIVAAGFDWTIKQSPAFFSNDNDEKIEFPGRKILRRSDTQEALSVVTDRFRVVQPRDVLEFFRDLTERHGMKLSTAGILGGGKKFWALADVGKEAEITDGDKVCGQLLLTSSADGQMSTTAKFVSTRVVCANTLDIALRGGGKMVRVTHKREFDAKAVKIDLGLLDKSWENFVANLKKLADKKMDNSQLTQFVSTVFKDPTREVGKQAWGVERLMQTIIGKAKDGSGADMHRGTRWGALCGITEALTHRDSSRLSSETRFTEAYMGVDATTKMNAYLELLILA
jgi:phage/plasmid-like protein (TIGR03299 family)